MLVGSTKQGMTPVGTTFQTPTHVQKGNLRLALALSVRLLSSHSSPHQLPSPATLKRNTVWSCLRRENPSDERFLFALCPLIVEDGFGVDSVLCTRGPTLHNITKQSEALFILSTTRKGMEDTSEPPLECNWIVTTKNDAHVSVSRLNTPVVMVVCSSVIEKQRDDQERGCSCELETSVAFLFRLMSLRWLFDSSVLGI